MLNRVYYNMLKVPEGIPKFIINYGILRWCNTSGCRGVECCCSVDSRRSGMGTERFQGPYRGTRQEILVQMRKGKRRAFGGARLPWGWSAMGDGHEAAGRGATWDRLSCRTSHPSHHSWTLAAPRSLALYKAPHSPLPLAFYLLDLARYPLSLSFSSFISSLPQVPYASSPFPSRSCCGCARLSSFVRSSPCVVL